MPIKTARIAITRASAPVDYPELGIRFASRSVKGMKDGTALDMLLMLPAAGLLPPDEMPGKDGIYYHVLGGLIFKTSDGRAGDGEPGQLLVTQRRVLGMIEMGTSESGQIGLDQVGHVYCFAMNRQDIVGPKIKKRFMKASDFNFENSPSSDVAFTLKMYSAMVCIGKESFVYWHDQNMVRAFSAETLGTD